MGRKIPAKKHRGVKDPLIQQAKRIASLKGKINAPPRDPDEQPVPKSLLRLFGAGRERGERGGREKRVRGGGEARGGGGGGNPVSRLARLPGETARGFSARITHAVRALHDVVDPQHYPQQGEEEDEQEQPRRRRRRGPAPPPRPSRAQRRKEKMQLKKEQQAQERSLDARSVLQYERVSFGERCDAPPALTAPARAARATHAPRPGRRDLLLTRLLHPDVVPAPGEGAARGAAGEGAAERRRLDAVAAYRALKARQRAPAAHTVPAGKIKRDTALDRFN